MKLLFLTLALFAGADFMESAVRLSGASCVEDLSQSEIEQYEALADHPLDLNRASRRELISSGLFSPYQAATITDYISNYGEICSIAELGTVDGIGPERARDLAPFVLLEPSGPLGARPRKRLRADSMLRLALKNGQWSNAAKASAGYGGLKAGFGAKNFSPTAGYLSWGGRRVVGQLTVGDFNARFGQGLLTWTGFTMTTLYTLSAFARSGTGISGSNTLSEDSAKRGAAAELVFGNAGLSLYATLDGETLAHLQYLTKRGSYGATLLRTPDALAGSAEWRFTLRKFTLFGEAALQPQSASLRTGLFYNHSYGNRAALLLRRGPDEMAAALGAETRWASITAEASRNLTKQTRQLRTVALCSPQFTAGPLTIKPSFRLNSRYRPGEKLQWRNDLRSELEIQGGPWLLHGRYNALSCENWAWLSYLEAGYKNEITALYLRGSLFKVDNWNDRIYSYERDAPGSFNVPAYYGRGYALALYVRWRFLALRAATTRYPWTPDKPSKYELKIQFNYKL
jgi:hypothetical protein